MRATCASQPPAHRGRGHLDYRTRVGTYHVAPRAPRSRPRKYPLSEGRASRCSAPRVSRWTTSGSASRDRCFATNEAAPGTVADDRVAAGMDNLSSGQPEAREHAGCSLHGCGRLRRCAAHARSGRGASVPLACPRRLLGRGRSTGRGRAWEVLLCAKRGSRSRFRRILQLVSPSAERALPPGTPLMWDPRLLVWCVGCAHRHPYVSPTPEPCRGKSSATPSPPARGSRWRLGLCH